MIDLTPLDVRKKRGDFGKALRGYDAEEVDAFLELVSERMEELVKENLQLSERTERLTEQVSAQEGREKAVQEALVTAQALREDVKQQAIREAELTQREAQTAIDQTVAEAERLLEERKKSLGDVERHRLRFLKAFRALLERELDTVEVEESRTPLEDVAFDIDLGGVGERIEATDGTDDDATGGDATGADASGDEEIPEAEVAEVLVEAEDDAVVAEAEGDEAEEETDGQDGSTDGQDEATDGQGGEAHAEGVSEAVVGELEVVAEEEAPPDEAIPEEVVPEEESVAAEAEPFESVAEVDDPAAGEPATDEEREAAGDGDDDSLWLNSLLDGESRDEGRWG